MVSEATKKKMNGEPFSGCGDANCWCYTAKRIVFADNALDRDRRSAKPTDPFHRGWWLENHPELSNGKKD